MFSLFFVVLGSITILIIMWVGTAIASYEMLHNAAEGAAFAGQSQTTETVSPMAAGYTSIGWTLDPNSVISAAQTNWNQSVVNDNLEAHFSNLNENAQIQGNYVIVTVTGDYLPGPLDKIATQWPQVASAIEVPMSVTLKQQYYIAN